MAGQARGKVTAGVEECKGCGQLKVTAKVTVKGDLYHCADTPKR
jgi:hypothetical protein